MAKLVFGNTKQTVVPAVVKEKQPVIDTLNVTPTTSAQTITAPSGTDGYSPVNVSAVDSSIDANIVAGNIKSGVSILGVNGSVVELNGTTTSVTPTTSAQTITPTAPNNGFTEVSVSAVTSAIDSNIQAGNIKQGVTILGVAGNYSGITPTGTLPITTNGIYDVTNYASADVQVPSSAPAHYVEKTVKANGKLINGTSIINLNGVTDVDEYVLSYAYYKASFSANTSVDFSDLTTISGNYACSNMFQNCTGLTSVNLSGLTTVKGSYACYNMFQGCTGITSVDLSGLTTVSGTYACASMFSDCSNLASVNLTNLKRVTSYAGFSGVFSNCTSLTSIYLPSIESESFLVRPTVIWNCFPDSGLQIGDLRNLRTVGDYGIFDNFFANTFYLNQVNVNALEHIGTQGARAMFWISSGSSSSLTDVYFPMLTTFGSNPFYTNSFQGRLGVTIHFRKDTQATVEALQNYATLWGAGTGSSVVFDLAGTLTGADSNSYARSEKDSVYASETAGAAKTATAWSYNNTIYYTSGGAEPSVGDTIYSDSACTTAVTTISSIA